MAAESGNIATNELTSPKTLGTSLNSSMGKSAGKWASTPPLLPIKSYAAVEPELMKEIEKLQAPSAPPLPPALRHRLTFPLIDFFFSSSLSLPFPSISSRLPSLSVFLSSCLPYFVSLLHRERRLHDSLGSKETPEETAVGNRQGKKKRKRGATKAKLKGCIGRRL